MVLVTRRCVHCQQGVAVAPPAGGCRVAAAARAAGRRPSPTTDTGIKQLYL